mgnify:CR=1 FL=1
MKNTTIAYSSPSGFINTGKLIPPFQPLKKGFGFLGVLAEDSKSLQLQCHICGKWFYDLNSHARQKHHIEISDYKDMFSLSRGTALLEKSLRLKHSRVMTQQHKKNPKKFRHRPLRHSTKGIKLSVERQNKFGTCDLQIATKIKNLYDHLKRTPRMFELEKYYGRSFCYLIKNRYQSYSKILKELTLPQIDARYAPKYSRQYFIDKGVKMIMENHTPFETKEMLEPREWKTLNRYFGSVSIWKNEVLKVIRRLALKSYDGKEHTNFNI